MCQNLVGQIHITTSVLTMWFIRSDDHLQRSTPLRLSTSIELAMSRRIGTCLLRRSVGLVPSSLRWVVNLLRDESWLTASYCCDYSAATSSNIYKELFQQRLTARVAMHSDRPLHPKPTYQSLSDSESDFLPIKERKNSLGSPVR